MNSELRGVILLLALGLVAAYLGGVAQQKGLDGPCLERCDSFTERLELRIRSISRDGVDVDISEHYGGFPPTDGSVDRFLSGRDSFNTSRSNGTVTQPFDWIFGVRVHKVRK